MEKTEIKLSKMEIQSNFNRVRAAEGLIEQLPLDHDGRNSWLMNFGIREEAQGIRRNDKRKHIDGGHAPRELIWNDETECLDGA